MTETLLKAIIVILAGVGINLLPVPFESEAVFAFGFAAGVFAALMWGLRLAIPITLFIAAPLLYSAPSLEVVLITAQVVIIGSFGYRQSISRPLIVTLIFWVFIAMPLLAFKFYEQSGGIGVTQAGVILTNFIVSLAVSLAGHLAFIGVNILRPSDRMQAISMSYLFRYFFTSLFFFATLSVSFVYIGFFQQEKKQELELFLTQRTEVVAQQLNQFLHYHRLAIDMLSKSLQENPAAFERFINSMAEAYPDFLTFLMTDEKGQINAAYPAELYSLVQQSGQLDVSFRDYFQYPKDYVLSYVSPVLRGKGFGTDPIVAISAPLLNQYGQFLGIVEGSLNLSSFEFYDQTEASGSVNMLIADNRGTVVYASESLALAPMTELPNSLCLGNQCSEANWQHFAQSSWMSAQSQVAEYKWSVIKFFPKEVFATEVSNYIVVAIIAMLVLTLIANFASYWLARALSQPLAVLLSNFEHFDPARPDSEMNEETNLKYVREIAELEDGFGELRQRLIALFGELNQARHNHEQLNQELFELNSTLEERVNEKTASLEIALKQSEEASEAKSRFLANMSHEIRTPMNGILGSCQNMMSSDLSPQDRRKLEVIHYSATAMMDILNSILDWSKIESGKMVVEYLPFTPEELINNCLELHRPMAENKGLGFDVHLMSSLPPWLEGDPTKISQIINNLLNNAIKFTERGSVQLEAFYQGGEFVVRIIDTGIGISEAQRQKVFEEFAQADVSTTRHFGGTGLGLAIALNLTRLMGGELELESELNKGTTVTLRLPAEIAQVGLPEMSQVHQALPKGLKILMAEDNDINAEVLMGMLADQDVRLIRVTNGKSAVEAARHHSFDVILLDCQMPEMDGYEAARLIRNMPVPKCATPIIALTANAYIEDRKKSLAAGMNAHLSKPVQKQALISMILNYLPLSRIATEEAQHQVSANSR